MITRQKFIEWLEKQPPERGFDPRNLTLCPLATAITELHGKKAMVDKFSWGFIDDPHDPVSDTTPGWVYAFIVHADALETSITAKEALRLVLDAPDIEVRKEAGCFSIYVNDQRMVDRESYIVASNIVAALINPRKRALPTESAEVARSILKWLEKEPD